MAQEPSFRGAPRRPCTMMHCRDAFSFQMQIVGLLASVVLVSACEPPRDEGGDGSGRDPASRSVPGPDVNAPSYTKPVSKPQLVADNLDFPVDMARVENTKVFFFTEKATGKIRSAVGNRIVRRPCAVLSVNSEGERGTLGIATDPAFERNHWLYVYYTNAEPLENRVTRFTVRGNQCTEPTDIISLPADPSTRHNGGQLEFVGSKLFVAVGDGYSTPALAQDLTSPLGKILRFNRDGSIPEGNPFSAPQQPNPVWSYGFRNPFGLTHSPDSGRLYATDNGPECDDELNLVHRGGNYGWGPGKTCGGRGVGRHPHRPMVSWTPPIAPTDPWFYTGSIEPFTGNIFVGDFNTGRVHRFELNDEGTEVVRQSVLHDFDRQVADVSEGPRGFLYVLTIDSIKRFVGQEPSTD